MQRSGRHQIISALLDISVTKRADQTIGILLLITTNPTIDPMLSCDKFTVPRGVANKIIIRTVSAINGKLQALI